ncbi:MAG: methylated-DNA/protein-cysteinemethyltransferase [Acidimicrobiales bacterium]|nr:methylated-DNA/protein-cysteinemethyltransferase [Acidimicrobiales bacterium]
MAPRPTLAPRSRAVADRFAVIPSPVGDLILTGTGPTLAGCWFTGPTSTTNPGAGLERDDDAFADAAGQLGEYFGGTRRSFDLELTPVGTEFQLRVWTQLRTIPYGETWSYGQMAVGLGAPNASRAVGLANGRNPHSIIVPCHRVIGADGSLTGYGGGMDRKRFLLDLEAGISPLA